MTSNSAAMIRSVVARIERLDEELATTNEGKAEVYKEAKANGLDVRALKALVAERRKKERNPQAFRETNELMDLYRAALEPSDAAP